MHIVEYLCREARRITGLSLSDLRDREYWAESRQGRWRMLVEMLGLEEYLDGGSREAPEYEVT
ncbi:MAG: hypothetical protein DRJ67_03570, partial [Thermoprotei archaeon]